MSVLRSQHHLFYWWNALLGYRLYVSSPPKLLGSLTRLRYWWLAFTPFVLQHSTLLFLALKISPADISCIFELEVWSVRCIGCRTFLPHCTAVLSHLFRRLPSELLSQKFMFYFTMTCNCIFIFTTVFRLMNHFAVLCFIFS